jgi:hypothetical protein
MVLKLLFWRIPGLMGLKRLLLINVRLSFSPWFSSPSLFFVRCTLNFSVLTNWFFFFSNFVAFYLILDVAVGGTNGWFPDGSEKPWLDGSTSRSFLLLLIRLEGVLTVAIVLSVFLAPMLDFWRAKNAWLPTWPANEGRSMIV